MARRSVKNIIMHCSDSPNGRPDTAADIRRWHTDPKPRGRGWHTPGYHFVVEVDGHISPLVLIDDDGFLEPWEIANGVRGHNHNSIHICMIGKDQFSREQWDALTVLTQDLGLQFPDATLHGHREFDPAKFCPGFEVADWAADPVSVETIHLYEGV